jgi:hypothetical protein
MMNRNVPYCEGFRTPASRTRRASHRLKRAGVRKPAREGNRGRKQEVGPQAPSLWGFEGVWWWEGRAARWKLGFLRGR